MLVLALVVSCGTGMGVRSGMVAEIGVGVAEVNMPFNDHRDDNYAPILEYVSHYHALVCECGVKVCITWLNALFFLGVLSTGG